MCSFLRIHVGVCKGVHVIGDTRETNLVSRVQLSLHTSVLSRTCEPTRVSRRELPTHTHTDAHLHCEILRAKNSRDDKEYLPLS